MRTRYIAIAAAAALLAGCNTMQGAGEDIKAGARKVESAFSKDNKAATDPTSSNPTIDTPSTPHATTSGTDVDRTRTVPDTSMQPPPSGLDAQQSTPHVQ